MNIYQQAQVAATKEVQDMARRLSQDNAELKRLSGVCDSLRNRISCEEQEKARLEHLVNSLDVAARDADSKDVLCESR